MELEEAKERVNKIKENWHDLLHEKYCYIEDDEEALQTVLQELDRLQKENNLAKKALIANSYQADERNNLLAEVQRLKKENEKLKETDLTTVHIKGVCDEKERWRNKIREKIEEYKNSEEFYQNFPDDYMGDIAISLLQDLLKEE